MRVCLASTSPARLMLLRSAGIEPLTRAPQVDEEAVIAAVEAHEGRALAPDEHVLLLARRKASDVAATIAVAGSLLTWGAIAWAFGPEGVLAAVLGIVGIAAAVAVAEELARTE